MSTFLGFVALALATTAVAAPVCYRDVNASLVPGLVFDRFVVIYLENTDFESAAGDPSLSALAKQGITLTNMNGLTHPSEPNYIGAVAGEYFGLDNDNSVSAPSNVATLVDLLEDKGISWAEYQEDLPSRGFTGNSPNPDNGKNDYVRKHNPVMSFDSVTSDSGRLQKIKSLNDFNDDLSANALPQWMFITPNMTNDGHDTSVTVAGAWASSFLTPLLSNPSFNQKTLVLLTFDEVENYAIQNTVYGLLLGDAVPSDLAGTTDSNFYSHYSEIATVEANWGLHTLGRWDVGANVFAMVAAKTGDVLRQWASPNLLNRSYPGLFSKLQKAPVPAPNTNLVKNGRTVLPSIVQTWGSQAASSYYTDTVELPDGDHPPPSSGSSR